MHAQSTFAVEHAAFAVEHAAGIAPPASPRTEALPAADQNPAQLVALVERLVFRDERALSQLYDATSARIYSLALWIVKDAQTAEEVVCDVYHQAWRDACNYDPGRCSVMGWMQMICRSRAVDAYRRRDVAILHPEPFTLNQAAATSADDSIDLLEAVERSSDVHRALLQLSPTQRQIVALAFFRDCTHAEISRSMAMPLGTVKTLMRRALQVLRTAMVQP